MAFQITFRSQSNDLGSQSTVSKIEAANFIKIILLSIIGNNSFNTQKITSLARKLDIEKTKFSNYFCRHQISRRSFIAALNGLFIAVFNTETRTQMLPFFKALIKYLTIQTILESNKGGYYKSFHNTLIVSIGIYISNNLFRSF